MRSGDIGDEAAWSAEEADTPIDLDAVRADDDLIEALAAGLVPPPCGPRDPNDVEGELVALLAGWVADVRPETLLHRPDDRPAAVRVLASVPAASDEGRITAPPGSLSLLEYDELPAPVALAGWRRRELRPLLLRAAASLVAIAMIGSAVVAGSYDARPGEPLWLVAQVVFPEKSHSVEAATAVSTGLNTARVALERGRFDEARVAFEAVAAQLADVDDADGRAELTQQSTYLNAQLNAPTAVRAQQVSAVDPGKRTLAMGQAGAVIRSNPVTTPGATKALSTPTTSAGPAVAAAPGATSPGVPTVDIGGSSGAVLAAPEAGAPPAPSVPSDPIVSAPPPAVSGPEASAPAPVYVGSGSPPPAAEPPPVVSSTTAPPPDSPVQQSPPPQDPPPVTTEPSSDPGPSQTDQSGSGGSTDTGSSGAGLVGGDTTTSASSGTHDSSSATEDSAKVDISTEGSAGSTLGAVAGVVSSADNPSS